MNDNKKLILLKTMGFKSNKESSFIRNNIIMGVPPKMNDFFNFKRKNNNCYDSCGNLLKNLIKYFV